MHDALFAIHLIGLMMLAGGGFGGMLTMQKARRAPAEEATALRHMGPRFARFSAYGLIVLWITGVAMTFDMSLFSAPLAFWIKIGAVVALTAFAVLVELTYAAVTSGKERAGAPLPALGALSGLATLLAVVFAVLAFH